MRAVHVWFARFVESESLPTSLRMSLSTTEREKAARFLFAEHRSRYVFAHVVLRHIISGVCSIQPADIEFVSNAYGKPGLPPERNPSKLTFNMSHSGDAVAVAVTSGAAIGIDIEAIRPLKAADAIAKDHFTASELDFMRSASAGGSQDAFYRCWVRKESYIKAVGKGLSIPLTEFDTSFPVGSRRILQASGEDWCLADLIAPPGFAAAITVANEIGQISYFDWRADADRSFSSSLAHRPIFESE